MQSADFIGDLFGNSNGRVFLSTLPNPELKGTPAGEPDERHIWTRSREQIGAFVAKWNRPGRAVYLAVSTFQRDTTSRCKDTVQELIALHADIDFRGTVENPEEILRIVERLTLAPSLVIHSGHGLHLYWVFNAPIPATAESKAEHDRLLRRLADHLGADAAVAHCAALMRLPGTTNSKNGDALPVHVVTERPNRYALDELKAWLEAATPVIHRKADAGNGASPDNPFLAFARALGVDEAPLNVEESLATMVYLGPGGGGNAHDTLLRAMASMARRGVPAETAVAAGLKALTDAAARSGISFDPVKETAAIGDMYRSGAEKFQREPEDDRESSEGKTNESAAAEDIEPVNLWGQFDPPPLPQGLLPETIECFAREEAELMGVDPGGIAIAALAVCAAALPDHTQLQVKRHDPNWLEAARLWVGLIGNPSTKKTPIILRVAKPLKRLDAELWRRYVVEMERYDQLSRDERKHAERPKQQRLRLEDTTIEAAQEVLKDSPDGVLCIQDELAGWFGAMDKYAGRGATKDRAFWLQSFHGGPYALNRVSRSNAMIENLSVSLLGGIQPEPMRKIAADTIDDGLLQRLVPIVLQRGSVGQDAPRVSRDYDALIIQLHERPPPPYPLQFTDAALAIRHQLEQRHLDLMACEIINRKLAAHIGKYDGLFARLCLLWHCIEGNDDLIITEHTAQRVADFMHRFLLPHATAFYADMLELSDDHDRLTKVAGYILAKKLSRVTNRDVQRGSRAMRGLERLEIESIFEQLEALGWLMRTPSPYRSTPLHWQVNPEVHRRFAERAVRETTERAKEREILQEMFKGGSV